MKKLLFIFTIICASLTVNALPPNYGTIKEKVAAIAKDTNLSVEQQNQVLELFRGRKAKLTEAKKSNQKGSPELKKAKKEVVTQFNADLKMVMSEVQYLKYKAWKKKK